MKLVRRIVFVQLAIAAGVASPASAHDHDAGHTPSASADAGMTDQEQMAVQMKELAAQMKTMGAAMQHQAPATKPSPTAAQLGAKMKDMGAKMQHAGMMMKPMEHKDAPPPQMAPADPATLAKMGGDLMQMGDQMAAKPMGAVDPAKMMGMADEMMGMGDQMMGKMHGEMGGMKPDIKKKMATPPPSDPPMQHE